MRKLLVVLQAKLLEGEGKQSQASVERGPTRVGGQ